MKADISPFRLTIISGYPGAGKTTWLRRQIREGVFRSHLLFEDLERMRAWLTEKGAAAAPRNKRVNHLVLETSGLTSPAEIVEAIHGDGFLSSHLRVAEIVVVVDGEAGLRRLASEAVCRAQVAMADCVIVTRLDAAGPETVAVLLATLSALNPVAPIFGSARGAEVAFPPHGDVGPIALPQEAGGIVIVTLPLNATMNWTALELWLLALLHAHGPNVLRVKGLASGPDGRLLVRAANGQPPQTVIVPAEAQAGLADKDSIVIVGRGFRAEDLKRSLSYFLDADAQTS